MNIRDIIAYFDSLNVDVRQAELEVLNRLYPTQPDRATGDDHARPMGGYTVPALTDYERTLAAKMPSPQQGCHRPFAQPYDTGIYGHPQQPQMYLDPRTGQHRPADHYTAPASIPAIEPLPYACSPAKEREPCVVIENTSTGDLVQLSADTSAQFLSWQSEQGRYGATVRLSEVNLRLPHQPFSRPVNYRPLVLKVNDDAATARVVMVSPSISLTLPDGKDNTLEYPDIVTIRRHGYSYGEISGFNTYVYPYIPETGQVAYTSVLERLAHLYKEDHDREELLEKEVEDFSFGDEGLVDDNKRNRIPLHRQDFYRLIREMGLYKEIGSGIQWVDDWAEGKPNSDELYRRHISTLIRNGGEVGYENNKFYVAYSQ